MRLPSDWANGSSRARAPVATMMCLAASSVALPSAPATDSLPLPVSFPSPITTAILFFFIRCATPWFNCFATARLRATTLAMSNDGFSSLRP